MSTLASAQMMPPGHTVLYLLENSMQLSKLFCNKLFFAVCKGGDDHFEFIAGECPEEAEHKLDGKE